MHTFCSASRTTADPSSHWMTASALKEREKLPLPRAEQWRGCRSWTLQSLTLPLVGLILVTNTTQPGHFQVRYLKLVLREASPPVSSHLHTVPRLDNSSVLKEQFPNDHECLSGEVQPHWKCHWREQKQKRCRLHVQTSLVGRAGHRVSRTGAVALCISCFPWVVFLSFCYLPFHHQHHHNYYY